MPVPYGGIILQGTGMPVHWGGTHICVPYNSGICVPCEIKKMKIKIILIISLVLLGVLVIYWQSKDSSKLVFCDVGQGDAMLIREGNWEMLLDVGGDDGKVMRCLERHVPFWDKTIELVIISHWDKDHCGGLIKLSRYYKINDLLANRLPGGEYEQYSYSKVLEVGDVVQAGKVRFDVISSGIENVNDGGEENDSSLVGILYYRDNKILMMGDAGAEVEQKLVWRGMLKQIQHDGGIDILKVSHHGSGTSTSDDLINMVRPKIAVVSVGRNSYGHPSMEVINRLENFGVEVKRTDKSGDVVVN